VISRYEVEWEFSDGSSGSSVCDSWDDAKVLVAWLEARSARVWVDGEQVIAGFVALDDRSGIFG